MESFQAEGIDNNLKNFNSNRDRIRKITTTAILIAAAVGLQMLEAPLPRMLPWLKPGLANVITLYSIIRLGSGISISIAAFRTCLAAIVLGSFLSPIHMISFAGSVTAAIVMAIIYNCLPNSSIGIISIIGAISNNISQLLVVQILFASNLSFWFHLGLIIWVSIPSGLLVGKITYELIRRN